LVIDEVTSIESASETNTPAVFNASEDFIQIAGSFTASHNKTLCESERQAASCAVIFN